MRCFIGIDLGSTTTKAVVIDENQNIIGRGITNSRSNYDTVATIAKQEALLNGRFIDEGLIREAAETSARTVDPPEDLHAPAAYRRALVATLIERGLRSAAQHRSA